MKKKHDQPSLHKSSTILNILLKILLIPTLLVFIACGALFLPIFYYDFTAQYIELDLDEIDHPLSDSTTYSRHQHWGRIDWIVKYKSHCPEMYCESFAWTMHQIDQEFQDIDWIVDEKSTNTLSYQCGQVIPEFKPHEDLSLEYRQYKPGKWEDMWGRVDAPIPYACVVVYSENTTGHAHYSHIVVTVNPILLWDD